MVNNITSINFTKGSLLGWCLYDFSGSIATVIGGIYFSKWFTEDIGAGSLLLNSLFFLSALFILITGRWVGKKIDAHGYKSWIKLASLLAFIAILLLFIISQFLPVHSLTPISFILFFLFLFGYQVSRICHNVYLHRIIPELMQSKMSGLGAASNWAGSIIGILLSIPFITAYPKMYGRELTFLVAAIGYGILTLLALLLMFRSTESNRVESVAPTSNKVELRSLLISSGSSLFIYFLLYDVMATVQKNLPPFLTQVFNMPDNVQAIGFLEILCMAMIGGLIAAKTVNFSTSKLWLKVSSFSLMVSIILVGSGNTFALWTAFATAGMSYGILESAMRINFMSTFSPKDAGKNFGILAIVERTSGMVGPLFWAVPFLLQKNATHAYTYSMLLMAFIALVAFVLLFLNRHSKAIL